MIAVQRWDGRSWTPIVLDVGGQCNILSVLRDQQGEFLMVGGSGSPFWARILRPNSGWSLPPPGMFSGTAPQAAPRYCFDDGTGPSIYGAMQTANLLWGVAKWDGAAWHMLGDPFGGPSLTAFASLDEGSGPKLVVCGTFTQIGSVACDRVARWTGTQWTAFPPYPNPNYLRAMTTFDDGSGPALYIGGDSPASGASTPSPVLKWSGQAWVAPVSALWFGLNGSGTQVSAMHVFDDGRGPALYVAGFFTSAGGVPANSLARWDGHAWEGVPGGVGFQTLAMADYNDGRGPSLFLGGDFSNAGGGTSPYIAQYVGCPNCYNNCDASTAAPALNINDFICFINAYARHDPYANCNLDAFINAADFQCFMTKFAAGCP